MFAIGNGEARLIVPAYDKHDNPVNVSEYLRMVCEIAGGATHSPGNGSWVDDNGKLICEPVHILDIACDAGSDVERSLADLGAQVAVELDQDAVYFRDASGTVHLIEQEDYK